MWNGIARSSAFFCLVASCAMGCSPKTVETGPVEVVPVLFPGPPDTPRVQFLARFSGSQDVEPQRSASFLQRLAGESVEDTLDVLLKPYGVTSFGGRIFVCDTSLGDVAVMDLRAGTYTRLSPSETGRLITPVNCEVDPADGSLYVADTGRGEVVVFDSSGAFFKTIGTADGPITDIAIDANFLWATSKRRKQVVVYDKRSGERIREFPDPTDSDSALLALPASIALTADEVYVVDQVRFRVNVYSHAGEFQRAFGQHGDTPGSFVRPKGISVGRDGVAYVVDAGLQNVQMFDIEGRLLMFFGGASTAPGYMYLPAQVSLDYESQELFREFVDPKYSLDYLILVTNQLGPGNVSVYGRIELKSAGVE